MQIRRQRTKRSANEILEIINDFFKQGITMSAYCKKMDIPRTTLHQWLAKYNNSIGCMENFNEAKNEIAISGTGFIELKNHQPLVKEIKEKANATSESSIVTLHKGDIKLEFNIECLKKVLGAFND